MTTNAVLEVFIHLDMVGRGGWQGDPEERPLTDIGNKQAEWLAEHLGAGRVDAVYASPNLRCRQSVAPLAKRFGVQVQDAPGFQDLLDTRGSAAESGPDVLANVYLAGSAYADLQRIRDALPEGGRAVICSNGGDIAPALATFVAAMSNGPMPARPKREGAGGVQRGGVYTLSLGANGASVTYTEPPADFPA